MDLTLGGDGFAFEILSGADDGHVRPPGMECERVNESRCYTLSYIESILIRSSAELVYTRPMTTLKIVNPADRLEALVSKHRNQTRASLALQVSESYFSDLIRGRRACSDRILKKLKLRRVIVDAPRRSR
jgi:hypothetical protein